jgi:hypothetical protein
VAVLVRLAAAALFVSACGGSSPEARATPARTRIPRSFDFVAIDGSHLSTERTVGRTTVIEVGAVLRRRTPRINVGAVVLEPPKNAPLVEAYAQSLEVSFPVALADQATLQARGPFGVVKVVPMTIVLDANGNEVWRRDGPMTRTEINAVLDGIGPKK